MTAPFWSYQPQTSICAYTKMRIISGKGDGEDVGFSVPYGVLVGDMHGDGRGNGFTDGFYMYSSKGPHSEGFGHGQLYGSSKTNVDHVSAAGGYGGGWGDGFGNGLGNFEEPSLSYPYSLFLR